MVLVRAVHKLQTDHVIDVLSKTGRPHASQPQKKHLMPSLHCCSFLRRRRRAHTQALPKVLRLCGATPAHTKPRTPSPPPRTRPAPAGASWVLTSLIREASLGVGLGVVFGAVWSTMQTGPVSKRIVEYYKNNPTQS